MKQNLMNSLMILSETIDELNRNFLSYKDFQAKQNNIINDDIRANELRLENEIKELKQNLSFQIDKNFRAREEIKNLITELKNKL